jgi:hypothetical protein
MSTTLNLQLSSSLSADQLKSICDLTPGQLPGLQNFINYLEGVTGGNNSASMNFMIGGTPASATVTSNSVARVDDVLYVLKLPLFAVSGSNPGPNSFQLNSNLTIQAANIARAINISATFAYKVTATSSGAVVTITTVNVGSINNGLTTDVSNIPGCSSTQFSGGTNGTRYNLTF